MEDGIYLGCPKCLSLSKGEGWYITITEATTFKAEVVGDNDDYIIEVRGGKITSWGQYWEDSRDELEELAKENGLVIAE